MPDLLRAGLFVRRHPLLRRFLAAPRAVRRALLKCGDARARAILDRLSLLAQDDIVIRVDEFNGIFAHSPKSDLFRRIIQSGSYEPVLARLFLQNVRADRDIVDVGANIGFYTVAGALQLTTGRVLAAEPTPGAFTRLRSNVSRNGVADRAILYNGLVGAESGQQTMHFIVGREEYSTIGAMTHPSVEKCEYSTATVPAVRLDELVRLHGLEPGLLKVDVEGAEAQVFAGATEVLNKFRPIVIAEVSNHLLRPNGVNGRDIVRIFERLDYRVIDPHDPRAEPGTSEFGDIFCTPREA